MMSVPWLGSTVWEWNCRRACLAGGALVSVSPVNVSNVGINHYATAPHTITQWKMHSANAWSNMRLGR